MEQTVACMEWESDKYAISETSRTTPILSDRDAYRRKFQLDVEFVDHLEDLEVKLEHPRARIVRRSDLFVYPDLVGADILSRLHEARWVRSNHVNDIRAKGAVIIGGGDDSGKTTLAKALFTDFHKQGMVPVLLNGRTFDKKRAVLDEVSRWVESGFSQAYGTNQQLRRDYLQLAKERLVVIVDDFHATGANARTRDQVAKLLVARFETVVLMTEDEFAIEGLGVDSATVLHQFARFSIAAAGYKKRSEFIELWCSMGAESLTDDEIVRDVERLERRVDFVIQNSLLPSYPGNILILMSLSEVEKTISPGGASSAMLYEAMLLRQLSLLGSTTPDANTIYTYLAYVAHRLYQGNRRKVRRLELSEWHAEYCAAYALDLDIGSTLNSLIRAEILVNKDDFVEFRQSYAYFYFVGRYLARNLSNQTVRDEVAASAARLYTEEDANVMLFLCYLSSDAYVIERVLEAASGRLAALEAFDIGKKQSLLDDLVAAVPEAILPDRDTQANRMGVRDELDDHEHAAKARTSDHDNSEPALEINGAVKTIEIIGQILRNYSGSIVGPQKRLLVEHAYDLGLRVTALWATAAVEHRDQLVSELLQVAIRRKPALVGDDESLRERARQYLFTLSVGVIAGILRHVSCAVGAEVLAPTFRDVLVSPKSTPTSYKAIDLSVRLDLNRTFPRAEIDELLVALKDNILGRSVLQALVVHNLRIFPRSVGDRQFAVARFRLKEKERTQIMDTRIKMLPE